MIQWLAHVVGEILGIGGGIALAQYLDCRVFRNNIIRYSWEGRGNPPQEK